MADNFTHVKFEGEFKGACPAIQPYALPNGYVPYSENFNIRNGKAKVRWGSYEDYALGNGYPIAMNRDTANNITINQNGRVEVNYVLAKILTGISGWRAVDFIVSNNHTWFADGKNLAQWYSSADSLGVVDIGLAAGSAAPTHVSHPAVGLTGTYKWCYAYYCTSTGELSSASPMLTHTLANENERFTIPESPDPTKCDRIWVYRTKANGVIPYYLTVVTNTPGMGTITVTDSAADTALDDTTMPYDDNDRCPIVNFLAVFHGRVFAAGNPTNINQLFIGKEVSDFPTAFPDTALSRPYIGDSSEAIKGLSVYGDELLIFKEHSIWVLTGWDVDDPFSVRQLSDTVGLESSNTIQSTMGGIVFEYRKKLYRYNGQLRQIAEQISTSVDSAFPSMATAVMGGVRASMYDPVHDEYHLWVEDTSDPAYSASSHAYRCWVVGRDGTVAHTGYKVTAACETPAASRILKIGIKSGHVMAWDVEDYTNIDGYVAGFTSYLTGTITTAMTGTDLIDSLATFTDAIIGRPVFLYKDYTIYGWTNISGRTNGTTLVLYNGFTPNPPIGTSYIIGLCPSDIYLPETINPNLEEGVKLERIVVRAG